MPCRKELLEEQMRDCTFKPSINHSSLQVSGLQPGSYLRENTSQPDSGGAPAHERLYNRRNEVPKAFERHAPTWERESAECTFAPEIIAEPPLNSSDTAGIPGYEGTINRLRNATMQREEQTDTLTKSAYTAESYERSRLFFGGKISDRNLCLIASTE